MYFESFTSLFPEDFYFGGLSGSSINPQVKEWYMYLGGPSKSFTCPFPEERYLGGLSEADQQEDGLKTLRSGYR